MARKRPRVSRKKATQAALAAAAAAAIAYGAYKGGKMIQRRRRTPKKVERKSPFRNITDEQLISAAKVDASTKKLSDRQRNALFIKILAEGKQKLRSVPSHHK